MLYTNFFSASSRTMVAAPFATSSENRGITMEYLSNARTGSHMARRNPPKYEYFVLPDDRTHLLPLIQTDRGEQYFDTIDETVDRARRSISGYDTQVPGHPYLKIPKFHPVFKRLNLILIIYVPANIFEDALGTFSGHRDDTLNVEYRNCAHITISILGRGNTTQEVDAALQRMPKPRSFECRLQRPLVIPNPTYPQFAVLQAADANPPQPGQSSQPVPLVADGVSARCHNISQVLWE